MSTTFQPPTLLAPVTAEDLSEFDFHLPTVKVISYAGPGKSGGVSTSLEPVVKRLGTKVHWFSIDEMPESFEPSTGHDTMPSIKGLTGAHGSLTSFAPSPTLRAARSNAERVNSGFNFYRPDIPQHVIDGHQRFAAQHLYPLLHSRLDLLQFNQYDWRSFNELCISMASSCQSVNQESYPTLFWLHDYQFALVSPLVAAERGSIVCQFWHVPWPKAEIFTKSPVAKELVAALLSNTLLGFHTAEYAHNFMETVQQLFPTYQVDHMSMIISGGGRKTRITVMPLGIDVARWSKIAHLARPMAEVLPVKHRLANQILLGVDRLDYSKGVLEKLLGLERFLEENPEMHRRFHYVQISQPPQSNEKAFTEYEDLVNKKIDAINVRFEADGWKPIVSLKGHYTQEELAAWYQAADIMTVNSTSDGLNLIAKEFVACRQDEQGVLILSERAGCAKELSQGAIVIDPVSASEFATAISKALSMPIEEKRRRMTSMRHIVGWNQLHDWALGFLKQAL